MQQQQQPSTPGSCLYANAGLTQEACFLLSCWLCTAGFTSLYTTIQFDRNINCDDVVFLLLLLLSRTSTTNNEISLGSVVPINGGFTELRALVILFFFFSPKLSLSRDAFSFVPSYYDCVTTASASVGGIKLFTSF